MIGNIYGYSWWAIAAVASNLPWMNLVGWALWETHIVKTPGAGIIWVLAGMAWLITAFLQFVCWAFTLSNTRTYPDRIWGRGLAWAGVGIACLGPMFGFVYFVVL